MATINPTQSTFETSASTTPFPPSIAPSGSWTRSQEDDLEDGDARPAASVGPVVASIVMLFGLAVTAAFAGRGVVQLVSGFVSGS